MARPISDEELQLKTRARRRLVGAVVLVTAAAIVLPMVLDSEPRSANQNVEIHIPSPNSPEFKPKGAGAAESRLAQNVEAAAAKTDRSAAATPPQHQPAAAPAAAEAQVASAASAVREKASEPEPRSAEERKAEAPKVSAAKDATGKEPTTTDAARAAAGAYVVQVAALSDSTKARVLEKQMAGAGVRAYTEVVNTQAGEVTRVRAGPYPSREAAEKARTQLRKAGLDGKVVPR